MSSIREVVSSGCCVGCGGCSVATKNAIVLQRNDYGYFSANLNGATETDLAAASKVCPFSLEAENESVLGTGLFAEKMPTHDSRIGYYNALYAGRVSDEEVVKNFSSGGLTSWVVSQLLLKNEIDAVIHVGEIAGKIGGLFEYVVSDSLEQLYGRTKSRYYSVSFADVVNSIRGDGKRYAFVGVPCYVKAVRLVCQADAEIKEQIPYSLALVCGHMKSAAFAELLAWQIEISPEDLTGFDFRVKDPSSSSNNYRVEAHGAKGGAKSGRSNSLYGSNWGHAFFQLKSCDYCDDVMGELADASFGDAWLPKYESNWRGTNVLVCRNDTIKQLLLDGKASGGIVLDVLNESDVVASQAGNYRHRWDGLSVRLSDASKKGEWVPVKRIKAGERNVSLLRKGIVRLRQRLASESHAAFQEAKRRNDLGYFMRTMTPLTDRMAFYGRLGRSLSRDFLIKKLFNPVFYIKKIMSKLA